MVKIYPNLIPNIKKIPLSTKQSEYPLAKIKLSELEGIQKDIPLFDDKRFIPLEDIAFITKRLETLNLFRGCALACTHCLKNAKRLATEKRTILFEDLERFTSGFKTLSERFGFNVLQGNKYLGIVDDSNPSDYPIKGLSRNHSVTEAMALIYEKLRIPTLFVTSGWNKGSKYAQENAEELVRMVKRNPDSVEEINISVNPFLGIMENSRICAKNGEKEKSEFLRDIYTSRMANTFATLIDLFSLGKASVIYRHAGEHEEVGKDAAKKLYVEIYQKLKQIIGSRIEEFPNLDPEVLTEFDKSYLIEPSGRGRRYFSPAENLKEQIELTGEILEWENLSKEDQRKTLFDYAVKCIDINGKIYTTKPAKDVTSVNTPIEIIHPTEIRLNYTNNTEIPPVFSDIEA